ncbi:single-stranded DNA-binding protein [Sinirhodobacter populi]|uniref:Single-stranded DNA-binding protein n=1 Tax=Paenirhodobacter populi TaxID=2306993 RepID=A0A443K7R2_9RHOB|nr:single-stranded DNA-binding protein [Sinirhodobacter populi]RWR28808.1 single-stranded DNA-binding protein [Sinirhodobacter populi]
MALNRCEFIGHLGRDVEVRTTQGGDKIANLRIAVTEKWRDKSGERKERTEWVGCVIFGALAKVAEQYLRKGSKVYIAGKFTTRKWQDQSGQDRYSTEINVQDLEMLDSPRDDSPRQDESNRRPDNRQSGYGAGGSAMDDDIPFLPCR